MGFGSTVALHRSQNRSTCSGMDMIRSHDGQMWNVA
jgi:hypothetical protein